MTDLPRFHKGSMGPLSFSDLNEMIDKLNAVEPLLEKAKRETTADSLEMSKLMIVFASRDQTEPEKYSWKQIIMHDDEVVGVGEEGYEELVAQKNMREGKVRDEKGNPLDTYGLSLDSTFDFGYAFCIPFRQIDSPKRYLLAPISRGIQAQPPGERIIAIIDSVDSWQEVAVGEGGHSTEALPVYVYKCKKLDPQYDPTGNIPPGDFRLGFVKDSHVITVLDFGLTELNKPTLSDNQVVLTERPLDVGTVITADRWTPEEATETFYWMSSLVRFDVDCDGG
jgi:predicted RNA-binding protein with PUA domain